MRPRLIVAASVLALLAGPVTVLGQTSSSSPSQLPPPGASQPKLAPRAPAPDPLASEDVSGLKGATVYGSDDKKIGTISTVLMKPESKTIDRLVVSEGGVLGVGSHRVALPIDSFKWDGEKDGFKISKTDADLKQMPAWTAASSETSTSMPISGSSTPPASKPATGGSTGGTTQ